MWYVLHKYSTENLAIMKKYNKSFETFFQQKAIGVWLDRGAMPNKLVIGFSSFGRTFSLVDPNVNEINSPTQGQPVEAEYTHYIGYISYYEVRLREPIFNSLSLAH